MAVMTSPICDTLWVRVCSSAYRMIFRSLLAQIRWQPTPAKIAPDHPGLLVMAIDQRQLPQQVLARLQPANPPEHPDSAAWRCRRTYPAPHAVAPAAKRSACSATFRQTDAAPERPEYAGREQFCPAPVRRQKRPVG